MSFHVLIQMHVVEQTPDELIGDLTEQDVKEIIVEPFLECPRTKARGSARTK